MAANEITAERVRELLSYNPETGVFARKRLGGGRKPSNSSIGCLWDGYIRIWIDGRQMKGHRLAWLHHYGAHPNGAIDHINGNRADNRIDNLRLATTRLNTENEKGARSTSITGSLGVSKTRSGKFTATIRTQLAGHTVQLYLGSYDTEADAHAVYIAAKRRLHDGCTI